MRRHLTILSLLAAGCMGGVGAAPVGEENEGIIGGTSDTGDPGVVVVFAQVPGAQSGSLCTGEVISPHVVLTAAHCVSPAEVGAGAKFIVFTGNDFNQAQQSQILQVKETHPNPAWNAQALTAGHDVGIVVLQNATTIKPLPYMHAAITQAMAGQSVRLVGYGLDNGTAQTGAGVKRQTTTLLSDFDNVLLHFADPAHETCNGDSGGPALMMVNGVETIVGTTSFGDVSCAQGGYDTRVDAETTFIDGYVKANDPAGAPAPTPTPSPTPSPSPPPSGGGDSGSQTGSPAPGDSPSTGAGGPSSPSSPTALAQIGQRCSRDADCASKACGVDNRGGLVCVAGGPAAAGGGTLGGCSASGEGGGSSSLALGLLLACGLLLGRGLKRRVG